MKSNCVSDYPVCFLRQEKHRVYVYEIIRHVCLIMLCALLTSVLFSVECSAAEIVDGMSSSADKISQMANGASAAEIEGDVSGETASEGFDKMYLRWCEFAKKWCPDIAIASIVFGVVLLIVVKQETRIRKIALFDFVIIVPVLSIGVMYGMCIMYGQLF